MTTAIQNTSPQAILENLGYFEAHYGYNADYIREIVNSSEEAALACQALIGLSQFKSEAPLELVFGVKLTATLSEDCGPCVQLGVKMAEEAGIPAANIKAILEGNTTRMSDEALLGCRFAEAVLNHDAAADGYRDEIVKRWGKKALIGLSFALVTSRIFPTLRYSMGYGQSCSRVMVDDQAVAMKH